MALKGAPLVGFATFGSLTINILRANQDPQVDKNPPAGHPEKRPGAVRHDLERIRIVDQCAAADDCWGWHGHGLSACIGQRHQEFFVFWAGVEAVEEIVDAPGGGVVWFGGVVCVFDGLVAELFAGVGEPLGVDGVLIIWGVDADSDDSFSDADDWPETVVHLGFAGEDEDGDACGVGGGAELAGVGADEHGGKEVAARLGAFWEVASCGDEFGWSDCEGVEADGALGFEQGHADAGHAFEVALGAGEVEGVAAEH